jgi:hypothetical protein
MRRLVKERAGLRRLTKAAESDDFLVRLTDGTVRGFDVMDVQAQMFLAHINLFRETSIDSEVLDAVRKATSESKAAFKERFGSIAMTNHVIASREEGAWVKTYTLHQDGHVEKVRHEGGSEEAERVLKEIQKRYAPSTCDSPGRIVLLLVAAAGEEQWDSLR